MLATRATCYLPSISNLQPICNLQSAFCNLMKQMARLERTIGLVLHAGVVGSSICLAAGLAVSFLGAGSAGSVLLRAGVVVLLATPVSRVLVSIVEYSIQREWPFVGLTATVLLELVASLVAAMYGRKL
jgi:uncharacterized membrane protein